MIFSHLWQSTLFAALAALLALFLKDTQARARCWLWLAASVKFLVPFAVLVRLGERFGIRPAAGALHTAVFEYDVRQTFSSNQFPGAFPDAPKAALGFPPEALIACVWIAGVIFVSCLVWRRWRMVQREVLSAAPVTSGRAWELLQRYAAIPMLATSGRLEPGVFGIFRPVLLWPEGITERLTSAQIEAIIAHEMAHVRRRDNLRAALHMVVETLFWFHPLVWWLGTRMVEERERACDEEVLRLGNAPQVYAESILTTCRFYLEAPVPCMSGVTGADLKKRIEQILTADVPSGLGTGRKLLLTALGAGAIAGPVLFGMLNAPLTRAQSPEITKDGPSFEVASIKPNKEGGHGISIMIAPGGRFQATNVTPKALIMLAYDIRPYQLSGGPSWLDSEHYDIVATPGGEHGKEPDRDTMKLMVRKLLADRFQLVVHKDSKEAPIYALVVGKSGPKLKPAQNPDEKKQMNRMGRGTLTSQGTTLERFAQSLSMMVGRNVMDKTGLAGVYDIDLKWTPDDAEQGVMRQYMGGEKPGGGPPPADPNGPSLFAAIQDQLGLKLEPQKAPVELVIIDRIEKATEN